MHREHNEWAFPEEEGGTTVITSYTDEEHDAVELHVTTGPDCDGTTSEMHYVYEVFAGAMDEPADDQYRLHNKLGPYRDSETRVLVRKQTHQGHEDPFWHAVTARDEDLRRELGWEMYRRPHHESAD